MIDAAGVIIVAASFLAAATHGYIFTRESILFIRPSTLRMFDVPPEHAPAVKMWAFHLGIYNLLLGATICVGAVALIFDLTVIAFTLIVAASVAMIVAATTLIAADLKRKRLPGLLAQALPPLVATATIFLGHASGM